MADILKQVHEGSAAMLTLNRPERRNALSCALIAELTTAVHEAGGDDCVRCVIITGAPPAFCAGLDLSEVPQDAPESEYDVSALHALYDSIETLAKPAIAAVNGPAMAGGAGLVTACDLAIFASTATIGYPGLSHGLIAPVVMPGLIRLVGERRARRLLLTGEAISANRALQIGLANEVVPESELMARAQALAETLAANSPRALAETKRLVSIVRDLSAAGRRDELRKLCSTLTLTEAPHSGRDDFPRRKATWAASV